MKSDTYTRQQIVRKLKRLKSRYERGIKEAKLHGVMDSYRAYLCMIASLDEAIAAFPPAKEK